MLTYQQYLEKIGEYGEATEVRYPLVVVVGLPNARLHEMVVAESGELGEIFSIEEDEIEILLYSKKPIRVGTKFVRTNSFLQVDVGNELLGWVINPLGEPMFGTGTFKHPTTTRDLLTSVKGISERVRIKRPFPTGVTIVDMLIPLGKGQKELVIGDRKIGKTSFILSTIKRQVSDGAVVIYAGIGKQQSDIKKFYDFYSRERISNNIIVVASSSSDSPSLIYLTPYVAMSIAEYYCELGHDVLVVLDDLSAHAKFYREISLIAKRFPGRDSYPGDIFFVHAKLLERTGNFKHKVKGETAITSLVVTETVEADLTGYIATNLMGMTDGHIYFDNAAYYDGRRPPINVPLSVTRVGRQTQTDLQREINREVTAFLSQYEKMQTYSHFGAELSAKVTKILKTGDAIYQVFQQHYSQTVPQAIQILLFGIIWSWDIQDLDKNNVDSLKSNLIQLYTQPEQKKMMDGIVNTKSIYDLLTNIAKNKAQLPIK